MDCPQGEGAASEAYRGESLRVDEALAADVHEKAGVVEKVCAEERALDLGDEEDPDIGLLAEGEGEAPRAEGLDRSTLAAMRELDRMSCPSCGEAGRLTCAPVSTRKRRLEEVSLV